MRSVWKNIRRAIGVSEQLPVDEPADDDSPPDDCVYWGGEWIPLSEAANHFVAVGASGSGKTVTVRLLAESALAKVGQGYDTRALWFDVKQDALPLLAAMCPHARVMTTNPFDARSVAWDISADVREPRVALEIVYTLLPREKESQPFFTNSARHLLYGVVLSFMLSGLDWTLADLMRAVSSTRRIKAILKKHPQTRDIVSRYWGDKRVLENIMSQLASKLLDFEPIAAAWDDAKEKISLRDWINDESIIVLGVSDISRAACDAISEAMLKRASDLALAQTESFTRRTWFFLDETSELPHLRGLRSILKRGRSKGICAVLAMQSIAGLRDPKLYGPHFTADILGQIGHKFFGRLECPETAEWASQLFGDQEIDQYTTSKTSSSRDSSTTRNHQIVVRRSVLPAELMDLPPCTRANGLTAYYISRSIGCYRGHLPGEELFDGALTPPDPETPEFIERPIEAQYLRPWTDAEAARFGEPPISPRSKDKKRQPKPRKDDLLEGLEDFDN